MRVIWSSPALADLRKIDDWLRQNRAPPVAARTIMAIRHRADFLQDFPRGGRPHRSDQRVLVVTHTAYLIRYRIVDGVVQVIRVYHERENWHIKP